jgi:hypothetical protein
VNAYSRLKRVLRQRQLSIPELHRRIRGAGLQVNLKSLYRLSHEQKPVERLDLRVAGAICRICDVPLSEWIVFEDDGGRLRSLSADQQARLEVLMQRNNAGQLSETERRELQALVRAAEEITLSNARLLAVQQGRLDAPLTEVAGSAS